jgi:hypothetical protein
MQGIRAKLGWHAVVSLDISGDLPTLLDSWLLHLRAERKSPQTVKTYGDGVRSFLSWCARENTPPALARGRAGPG